MILMISRHLISENEATARRRSHGAEYKPFPKLRVRFAILTSNSGSSRDYYLCVNDPSEV